MLNANGTNIKQRRLRRKRAKKWAHMNDGAKATMMIAAANDDFPTITCSLTLSNIFQAFIYSAQNVYTLIFSRYHHSYDYALCMWQWLMLPTISTSSNVSYSHTNSCSVLSKCALIWSSLCTFELQKHGKLFH